MKNTLLLAGLFLTVSCVTASAAPWSLSVVDSKGVPVPADVDIIRYALPSLHLHTDAAGLLNGDLMARHNDEIGAIIVHADGLAVGGGALRVGKNPVVLGAPRAVTGRVVDQYDKPLGQVTVAAFNIISDAPTGSAPSMADAVDITSNTDLRKLLTVRTNAAGRYVLRGLPAAGRAFLCVDDPSWRPAMTEVDLYDNAPAADLKTVPAAEVRGRVLQPDGRPAAHREVRAISLNSVILYRTETDENGAYRAGGLPPGRVFIDVATDPASDAGVAPHLELAAQAGEVTAAPDISLTAGATVEISCLPAVAGGLMQFRESWLDSSFAGSAIEVGPGTVRAHLAPGRYRAKVQPPPGYLCAPDGPPQNMPLHLHEGETSKVVISFIPALTVEGTARDEAGRPVAGARFTYDYDTTVTTDADGHFMLQNLSPGRFALGDDGSWDIVGRRSFVVPSPQPIILTLRKVLRTPLRGRVVDQQGRPISGVLLSVARPWSFDDPSMSTLTDVARHARSAPDGRYEIKEARADTTDKLTASKLGYRFVSGGALSLNTVRVGLDGLLWADAHPPFNATDIVMQHLLRQATGRVVNEGKPVASALVAALAGGHEDGGVMPRNIARTDKDGYFRLVDLPDGDIGFVAGAGEGFVQIHSAATELGDLVLRPQPRPQRDVALGKKMILQLNDLMGDTKYRFWKETLPYLLAPADIRAALDLAKTHRQFGYVDGQMLAGIVTLWVAHNPEEARQQLPAILPEIENLAMPPVALIGGGVGSGPAPPRLESLRDDPLHPVDNFLALVSATAGLLPHPELPKVAGEPENLATLRAWVRSSYTTRCRQLASFDVTGSTSLGDARRFADLAVLAVRLGEPSAQAWATSAVTIGLHALALDDSRNPYYSNINIIVARLALGGLPLVRGVLPLVPSDIRVYSIDRATAVLSRSDMAAALQLLAEMPPLPPSKRAYQPLEPNPTFAFVKAVEDVVSNMQTRDATEALELVRKIPATSDRALALALAARLQKPDAAVPLFREALGAVPNSQSIGRARVIQLALDFDSTLGRELLASTEDRAFDPFDLENDHTLPAGLLAQTSPGRARAWLEWRSALGNDSEKEKAAANMSMVDTARALEMASSLALPKLADGTTDYGHRFFAEAQIALYLMAPDNVRRHDDPADWYAFMQNWAPGDDEAN